MLQPDPREPKSPYPTNISFCTTFNAFLQYDRLWRMHKFTTGAPDPQTLYPFSKEMVYKEDLWPDHCIFDTALTNSNGYPLHQVDGCTHPTLNTLNTWNFCQFHVAKRRAPNTGLGPIVFRRLRILAHALVARAAAKPDIPGLFGGGHPQGSHLCESFWRILAGPNNGIHQRCVNPRHIYYETSSFNLLRSTCVVLSKRDNFCGCGASPPCLQFRDELYERQCAAAEELFQEQEKLRVELPSYTTFESQLNSWDNIPEEGQQEAAGARDSQASFSGHKEGAPSTRSVRKRKRGVWKNFDFRK